MDKKLYNALPEDIKDTSQKSLKMTLTGWLFRRPFYCDN